MMKVILVWETLNSKTSYDYENEIFSLIRSAQAWTNVILAGKGDSRRHPTTDFSENVVVAEASYQMLEVLSF